MTDLNLIRQTEQSLAALKDFAQKRSNLQLMDHTLRLETMLGALAAGDRITVGDISGSTAVAIGKDINIIINQVLPPGGWSERENQCSKVAFTYHSPIPDRFTATPSQS